MNSKTLLASILALSIAVPVLMAAEEKAEGASCKNCEMKASQGEGKAEPGRERARMQQRGGRGGSGEWQMGKARGQEFLASRKEMMELMKAYRANPTEENKAKLKARMETDFDAMVKSQEEQLKTMKQKKDEMIKERLEKMTQMKEKGEKGGKGGKNQKEKK